MLEFSLPGVLIFDRPPISNRLSSTYLEQLSSSFTSDSDISCNLWLSLSLEPFWARTLGIKSVELGS